MSILNTVVSGKVVKPPKLLVWGPAGVGKSTFASEAPNALFIEAEDRTGHLDINRIPVTEWAQVEECIKELCTSEDLPYRTVVFDTVDALEQLCFKAIAEEANVESHEEIGGGFAKFRVPMLKKWLRFMKGIDSLTKRGVQCILLAHSKIKIYNSPEGQNYDRFVLKMDQSAGDFLIENVDLVGYAKFVTFVKEDKATKKGKASTAGKRKLQFKFNPSFPTKQGVPCVDECDLSWDSFSEGLG